MADVDNLESRFERITVNDENEEQYQTTKQGHKSKVEHSGDRIQCFSVNEHGSKALYQLQSAYPA